MNMTSNNVRELDNKLDSLIVALNGGKGSGHFGHSGRKGKVGGSSPNGVYVDYYETEIPKYFIEQGFADASNAHYFVEENEDVLYEKNVKTDKQKEAIADYTRFAFTPINGYLRGDKDLYREEEVDKIKEKIETIDSCFNGSLNVNMVTYRAMRFNNDFKKPAEGDIIDNAGYTSTAINPESIHESLGKIVRLKVDKGTKALYIDNNTSNIRGENELLFPRNMKIKITKDYTGMSAEERYDAGLPDGVYFDGILYSDSKKNKNELSVKYNKLMERLKELNGGKGSGNFKHGGRPGKVGGSSSNNWSHNPSEKDLQNEFDNIEGYCLPVETAEKISELKEVNTYSKIKKFLSDRGITVDTDVEDLKGKYKDEVIDSPSNTFIRLAIGIEAYRDKFGEDALKSLKKVKFYDNEESTKAAYYYSELGEKEPKEGQISFRQWENTGREIFHELAHAYQDSHKREGEDAVTYSNRVVKEAKLSDKATAYTGAGASGNGKGMEAERFADSFARGFSYGNKEDLDFIDRVAKLESNKH